VGRLGDLLLPHRCPVCLRLGESPCPGCRRALLRPAPAAPPVGVDRCVAAVAYRGSGRAVVASVKFRGDRGPLPWLVVRLLDGLGAGGPGCVAPAEDVAVVTWVPATGPHRRRRGVDGTELLARAVAAELGRPARRLLRRGAGPPQVGRPAAARREGPDLSARVTVDGTVLVVDDVVTTGATASAAARAMRSAGASSVWFAAIART
jgi:predicted amidophosphoribosyltransferase